MGIEYVTMENMAEMVKFSCKTCGIEVEDYASNKRSSFCSLKCYWGYTERHKPWLGKKRSEDTKKKISDTKKRGFASGKFQSPNKGVRRKTDEQIRKNKALWSSQRRAVKRGNGGSHSLEEWENLKVVYKYTCPKCLKTEPEIRLTVDHILPVSMGGSNNIENIQPLCARCNSIKGNRNTDRYGF